MVTVDSVLDEEDLLNGRLGTRNGLSHDESFEHITTIHPMSQYVNRC